MGSRNQHNGLIWFWYVPVAILIVLLLLPTTLKAFQHYGLRWGYILLLSFAVCYSLTPTIRWFARRVGAMDVPDARKVHSEATPLLGGAAIFMSFCFAMVINGIFSDELISILIAAALLFIVGVLDDIFDIKAGVKLVAQIAAVSIVMAFGIVLRVIPDEYGITASIINILLTIMWIVGITNALNFFDGMDGMASGLGVIISFFLGLVAFQTHQEFLGWVAVAVMGSCLGFLPYNLLKKNRATIFLGDAGSTVIGFILACIAVYGDWNEGNHLAAVISPILIFWVLIFDMVHITVDRIMSGKVLSFRQWIEYVGRDHMHHRMATVLGGKRKSVLFIYLLSVCFGSSAVVLRNAGAMDAVLLLFQAVFMVALVTVLEHRGRYFSQRCDPENGYHEDSIGIER